jgi:hypothetical protein
MQAEGVDLSIESLGRGSVVNHRSFLLNDENDCSARCKTLVNTYSLSFTDLDNIRFKSDHLDANIKKIEHEMLGLKNPIAIDYIVQHPPHKRPDRPYSKEQKRNALTCTLKNSVVQVWLKIKE